LQKGGILAIVTFHALEDQIVKRFFHKMESCGHATLPFKYLCPNPIEVDKNRRSRTAKLRAAIVN